jgi:hypothetical protein
LYYERRLARVQKTGYNPHDDAHRVFHSCDRTTCMTDALRSDRSSAGRDGPDRERDARIEELLLTGLDHYFAGRHELAINVWTRVLFLDRGHARARAYIDRARGAMSERQREGDELLHTGAAALNRGDRVTARRLLTSALERGGSGEEALVLLHRLDRLDAASTETGAPARLAEPQRLTSAPAAGGRDQRVAWMAGGIFAGVLIAAVAAGYLWIVTDPFNVSTPARPLPRLLEDPLPVPSPGELRLFRARDLVARGQLREALALLEGSPPDEVSRPLVDELRGTIQRRLLDEARKAPSGSP